jgi:murein DD-endopeptidase MepM/ murein hydrolase activator NlpD
VSWRALPLKLVLFSLLLGPRVVGPGPAAMTTDWVSHQVEPGETWYALAWRYGVSAHALQLENGHPNRQQQPAIGAVIRVPPSERWPAAYTLSPPGGGLLRAAAEARTSVWRLALANEVAHPFRPVHSRTLFLPGGSEGAVELPAGVTALELSQSWPTPGQAIGLRGRLASPVAPQFFLDDRAILVFASGDRFVGLTATGAFYAPGLHRLDALNPDGTLWSQPLSFQPGEWTFQQITLTGEAAAIDQASIIAERERLDALWSLLTPEPYWSGPFTLPIENYLELTSEYGARRSYNGGPYRTYHEGVDFSAYGGTPVLAPAAGVVVLAERLYVRGGAVIIDHGLGVYSGYYHLSAVESEVGQQVMPGDVVGGVGTTGLSTGNHLHWDMLIGGTWVDGLAWLEQDLACWLLEGWGAPCGAP